MATHSSVLAWRSQGQGSLVDFYLWDRTESDMTEAMQQQQQQQQGDLACCNSWVAELDTTERLN